MNRALVVEDDPAWQEILSELLTDAGLAVDLADTVELARATLRTQAHRLAVVDLSLGGPDHRNQDGLVVLELLQRCDPGCTAILLTGYATVELAVDAIKNYGALTCLRKESFERAEFRRLLGEALSTPPAAVPAEERAQAPLLGPTALVVEDDAGWRVLLGELVTEAGMNARDCASYGEALGHLSRSEVALAVVDFSLAGSRSQGNADGFRLLSATREAGVPTLVVSGTAELEQIEQAYREQQVLGVFEKQSFDRDAFRRAVQAAMAPSELAALTEREAEVLDLLALGLTNNQIAERLFISTNTVKRHLKAIFGKLGVSTRAAAASLATRNRRSP